MKCGICAGRMNLALKKYPGVTKIDIKPEENTITVVTTPRRRIPTKSANQSQMQGLMPMM
jgi:copper chaperone CopZ